MFGSELAKSWPIDLNSKLYIIVHHHGRHRTPANPRERTIGGHASWRFCAVWT
jgi:hypothetical protein